MGCEALPVIGSPLVGRGRKLDFVFYVTIHPCSLGHRRVVLHDYLRLWIKAFQVADKSDAAPGIALRVFRISKDD